MDTQLNIRLDSETAKELTEYCDRSHITKSQIINDMIVAMLASTDHRRIMHIDGTPCPLDTLIQGLARETDKALTAIRTAHTS